MAGLLAAAGFVAPPAGFTQPDDSTSIAGPHVSGPASADWLLLWNMRIS